MGLIYPMSGAGHNRTVATGSFGAAQRGKRRHSVTVREIVDGMGKRQDLCRVVAAVQNRWRNADSDLSLALSYTPTKTPLSRSMTVPVSARDCMANRATPTMRRCRTGIRPGD